MSKIKDLLLVQSELKNGGESILGRTSAQSKKLKFASANAIRSCDNSLSIYNTHRQIHKSADRAIPGQMLNYKHAIFLGNKHISNLARSIKDQTTYKYVLF